MTFTDLFRATARRKVGGGSKSLGADQIDWAGVFLGRPLRLRTTVRAAEPMATFLTPSNARISYGMTGRTLADGHFVDVEVLEGGLTDPELADLAAIVAAADTRPVRARRRGEPVRSGVAG